MKRSSHTFEVVDRKREGSVAIIAAAMFVVMMGFAALVVDVGNLYRVRNELQNAADAAALAGARRLIPSTPSNASDPPTPPDWSAAETEATTAAPSNSAGGALLTDFEAQSGYWNFDSRTLQEGITPGPRDAPALQVTVRKAASANGGPVQNFFAFFFGITTSDLIATAIAVCPSPGAVPPSSSVLPMAISSALAAEASSHGDPGSLVRIESALHAPYPSSAGQWTSLEDGTSSANYIRGLIENGSPTTLGIGDPIWVATGTMTTLYNSVVVGSDVVLPVVNVNLNWDTGAWVPIAGFIGFHITASVGGSARYIDGYFIKDMYVGGSGSVGPNYGVYSPPKLAQ